MCHGRTRTRARARGVVAVDTSKHMDGCCILIIAITNTTSTNTTSVNTNTTGTDAIKALLL